MSDKYLATVELVKTIASSELDRKDRRYWFELYVQCSEVVDKNRLPISMRKEIQDSEDQSVHTEGQND